MEYIYSPIKQVLVMQDLDTNAKIQMKVFHNFMGRNFGPVLANWNDLMKIVDKIEEKGYDVWISRDGCRIESEGNLRSWFYGGSKFIATRNTCYTFLVNRYPELLNDLDLESELIFEDESDK